LAATTGCRIELAGRTSIDRAHPEPEEIGRASDAAALRSALLAAGGQSAAEVEAEVRAILARREVQQTVDDLRGAGSEVRYSTVDVRDGEAVSQLLKDIAARFGRLDGIVYAAGIIEDGLLEAKDDESFERVFHTKVDGARTVLATVARLNLRPAFVSMFGSVAAVVGNRGQADYAAANDALEVIGAGAVQATGARVLTVHWGPWAPVGTHPGMVSAALARDFARREVRLIDPAEGAASLLRELAYGPADITSVLYTGSLW
jgi:NAD(P)-dependent dehydrogenase (short-subunit alcohol dehydrogenase family)